METKQRKAAIPKVEPLKRKSLELALKKDQTPKEMAEDYAKFVLSPELSAYGILQTANSTGLNSGVWDGVDVPSLCHELRAQAEAVSKGDMSQVEAMLVNQASSLQSLSTRLINWGMGQSVTANLESMIRLGLRAQNQCRATLETLAAIKNPPVVFAKQANINNGGGNQQVNNGTPPVDTSHAGKTINLLNCV